VTIWRRVSIALGFVLVAVAVWFAWPLSTVFELKQALESRNADRVARHVDFAALKANMQRAAHEKIENQESGSVVAPVKDAVIEVIADDKLDGVASPDGMIHLVCDQSAGDEAQSAASKPCELHGKVLHIAFQSLSRFGVLVRPDKGKAFTLVMARRGRRWLLVDLVYAQAATPSDASNTVH